jgi:hypothetical protein
MCLIIPIANATMVMTRIPAGAYINILFFFNNYYNVKFKQDRKVKFSHEIK